MSKSDKAKNLAPFYVRSEELSKLIYKMEGEKLWDAIKARDVPGELVEYVMERLEDGYDTRMIRKQLGIRSSLDKSWIKILAAIRGGIRVDSHGLFLRWLSRNEKIAERLNLLITDAMAATTDKNGQEKLPGLTKELGMSIDALNRLQQGTVKVGRELGVIEAQSEGGKSGGTTIVINSNFSLPSRAEIEAHQKKTIEVKGEPVSQAQLPKK